MDEMHPVLNDCGKAIFADMDSVNTNGSDNFFSELGLLESSTLEHEKQYLNVELDSLIKSLGETATQPLKNADNPSGSSWCGELSYQNEKLRQTNKELKEDNLKLEFQMAEHETKLSKSMQDFIKIQIVAENLEKNLHCCEQEKNALKLKLEQLEAEVYQYRHLKMKNVEDDDRVAELQKQLNSKIIANTKLKSSLLICRTKATKKQKQTDKLKSCVQSTWNLLLEFAEVLSKVGLLSVKRKSVLKKEFSTYYAFLEKLEIQGDKDIEKVLDQLPAEPFTDLDLFIRRMESANVRNSDPSCLVNQQESILQKQIVSSSVPSPPLAPPSPHVQMLSNCNVTQPQNVVKEKVQLVPVEVGKQLAENNSLNQVPCSPDSLNLTESEKDVLEPNLENSSNMPMLSEKENAQAVDPLRESETSREESLTMTPILDNFESSMLESEDSQPGSLSIARKESNRNPHPTTFESKGINQKGHSKNSSDINDFPISELNEKDEQSICNNSKNRPIKLMKRQKEKSIHSSEIKTMSAHILSHQTSKSGEERVNLGRKQIDESYPFKHSIGSLFRETEQSKLIACKTEDSGSKALNPVEQSNRKCELFISSDNSHVISVNDIKQKVPKVEGKQSGSLKKLTDACPNAPQVSKTAHQLISPCDSDEDIDISIENLCKLKQLLGLPSQNFKCLSPLPPTPPYKIQPCLISDTDLGNQVESSSCYKKLPSLKKKLHFTSDERSYPVVDSIDNHKSSLCANSNEIISDQSSRDTNDQSLNGDNFAAYVSESLNNSEGKFLNIPAKRFHDRSMKQDLNVCKPKCREVAHEIESLESIKVEGESASGDFDCTMDTLSEESVTNVEVVGDQLNLPVSHINTKQMFFERSCKGSADLLKENLIAHNLDRSGDKSFTSTLPNALSKPLIGEKKPTKKKSLKKEHSSKQQFSVNQVSESNSMLNTKLINSENNLSDCPSIPLTTDGVSRPTTHMPVIASLSPCSNEQGIQPEPSSKEVPSSNNLLTTESGRNSLMKGMHVHQKPNLSSSFKKPPGAEESLSRNKRGKPVSTEETSAVVPVRIRGRTLQSRAHLKNQGEETVKSIDEASEEQANKSSALAMNSDAGDIYERPKKVRKEHRQSNVTEMFNKFNSDQTGSEKTNGSFSKDLNVNKNSSAIKHTDNIDHLKMVSKIEKQNSHGNTTLNTNAVQKFIPDQGVHTMNKEHLKRKQETTLNGEEYAGRKVPSKHCNESYSDGNNTVDVADSFQTRQQNISNHENYEEKVKVSNNASPFEVLKDLPVDDARRKDIWNKCNNILAGIHSASRDVINSNSIAACSEKKNETALKSKNSKRKGALKQKKKSKNKSKLKKCQKTKQMKSMFKHDSSATPLSLALRAIKKMRHTQLYSKQDEHSFVNAMLNPTIVPDKSALLFHIFQFLLTSEVGTILAFSRSNNSDVLLTVDERCIVTALCEIEKKRKPHLRGLLFTAVNSLHEIILAKTDFRLYGLSSLCRVLTEICRLVRSPLKPLTLCCDLLKMNHKFTPYLIASIAGVWKELFQVSNSMSNEELIFHSAIAYGAQQNNTNFKHIAIVEATKKVLSDFLNAPDVTDVNKIVDTLIKKIEAKSCSGLESDHEYALTAPLVIFAVYEEWSWTKEYLLEKHIIPGLMKYRKKEFNATFNVFCNLYAEIFSLCPGKPDDEILITFLQDDPVEGKTCNQDSAAMALIKLLLLQMKMLPSFLKNWIETNQTNPRIASIRVLLNRSVMSEETNLTLNDILC